MKSMRLRFLALVFPFVGGLAVSACNSPERDRVLMTIVTTEGRPVSVDIKMADLFEQRDSVLASARTDSAGSSQIEVPLTKRSFLLIEVNGITHSVYAEPGDRLGLQAQSDAAIRPVYFGDRANVNNYMAEALQLRASYLAVGAKSILHELNARLTALLAKYSEDYDLSRAETDLLSSWNTVLVGVVRQSLAYRVRDETGIDTAMFNPARFEFDTKLIAANLHEAGIMVHNLLQQDIYFRLKKTNDQYPWDSVRLILPLKADSVLSGLDLEPEILEFVRAVHLKRQLDRDGPSTTLQEMLADFPKQYPGSAFMPVINDAYSKWNNLAKGEMAPEISGLTLEGKMFSLQELRGSVVYVDVWATWCGPCVEEIPATVQLMSRFKKDDSVVFLAVSVDRNAASWKRMVAERREWTPLHISLAPGKLNGLIDPYRILSIPRYILIDKQGRIDQSFAPQPSSGDRIYEAIRLLMEDGA